MLDLIIASYYDIRYNRIPNGVVIGLMLIGFIFLLSGSIELLDFLIGGILPFLLLMSLGLTFEKSIGGGDIKYISALGCCLGIWMLIEIIFYAMLLICIFFIVRKCVFDKKSKNEVCMAPFVALGFIIALII